MDLQSFSCALALHPFGVTVVLHPFGSPIILCPTCSTTVLQSPRIITLPPALPWSPPIPWLYQEMKDRMMEKLVKSRSQLSCAARCYNVNLLAEGDELEGDEEDDEEMLTHLLRDELDDKEDDVCSPSVSSQSTDMVSMVVDCDLVEVCQRVAAKLGIAWPVTPEDPEVKRDICYRKRLSSHLSQVKQLLPSLSACVAKMK